jgi:hypothetical protein
LKLLAALIELYRRARRWLKHIQKDTGNLEPTPSTQSNMLNWNIRKMATAYNTDGVPKVKAILSSRDDWDTWYESIINHANERDVWDYFDPDANDDTRPDPPIKPIILPEEEITERAYCCYQLEMQNWMMVQTAIRSTNEAI